MCNIGKISRNKSYQWAVKKSQGRPYETSCNIFCNSFKLIGVYKSLKNIELYTIQGIICHPGVISRNKSDQWALKKYQGRPNETSCNTFCNSFKLIGVFKSPKNIELYTIEGNICHPGAISRNKSDHKALKKSQGRSYETSWNIFCNSFKVIGVYKSPKNI